MCVREMFREFLFSRQISGLSERTVKCYNDFVMPFIEFCIENGADTTDRRLVESYIATIYQKDISKASIATYIRHLKVFLRWAEEEYELDMGAKKIRVPRTPKKVLRVYTDAEITEIFDTARLGGGWVSCRNCAIIAMMLDSGLRQGETCSLLRKDVGKGLAKVCGKGDKERVVPFGRLSGRYMAQYSDLCPYVKEQYFVTNYGEPMSCDSVKHFMFKIAGQLPFEFSSHTLRHNFATNYCLDQYERYGQVDIYRLMVLMGHEDVATTRRYLHFANQMIASRGVISHLDQVFFPET